MSSDLTKRIASLEQQLNEAQEMKYRLEDELNLFTNDSEMIIDLHNDLHERKEIHAATNEKIQQLAEAKESLLKMLDEAKQAADDIDTISEELAAVGDAVESKQGALDEVLMSAHLLEQKLDDLESAQSMLQQEFSIAQTNEEYVGSLQKKINNVAEDIAALTADLNEATERKYTCEQSLFKALKSQQQIGRRLSDATAKAESIIPIEHKLMELDEVMSEETDKLATNTTYIEQLNDAIGRHGTVNESQNAELEACNARIGELTTELSEARTKLHNLKEEETQLSEGVMSILDAVDQCTQYSEIYKLEESFNKVGLTLQKTINDRMVLCRCHNNKVVTENVIDDYVFVGPAKRLHEGVINKIKSFVLANEGTACAPAHEPIIIMNEDKKFSLDFLVESERSL